MSTLPCLTTLKLGHQMYHSPEDPSPGLARAWFRSRLLVCGHSLCASTYVPTTAYSPFSFSAKRSRLNVDTWPPAIWVKSTTIQLLPRTSGILP